ncbi:hypothetical protein [Auritidibacter ignavus]|uniref:Uncharacterized protein n=1 Tax=Auritidibacter ignavus TaxID=678932 RepID=A0AAJ6DC93_9MICC|nr:hypothetical protein [Auritidibacter ignavus]WGH84081.1 hypothetical protein QDX20_00560 [Auritidibacter ignavus]WGH93405.1 hypothetical protein QDX21_00870 [Auritidibacter ignavus]WHS35142.1 hypothetical protein QM403_00830 [Auritidibacter ignavus]
MMTRAPRAGETLTAILDDWVDERDATSSETLRQNSRLRSATPVEVKNVSVAIRLDDDAQMSENVTTMVYGNGWWAPDYSQDPSEKFAISAKHRCITGSR